MYGKPIFCFLLGMCVLPVWGQQVVFYNQNPILGKPHDFAFVHLTDTHIGEGDEDGDYGSYGWLDEPPQGDIGYSAIRLRKTVRAINAYADSLHIKFVVVTGDITDSGERSEFLKFKEIMDELKVPYIPLIGNHDMWPYTKHDESPTPCGDSLITAIFEEQFQKAATFFTDWDNGTRTVRTINPENGTYNYFQNFSFTYKGYVFLLTDFGTRMHAEPGELGVGPQADLHDFAGGTFNWLRDQLIKHNNGKENIFLFGHWPMTKDPLVNIHLSSMVFGNMEYRKLALMLYPYRTAIAAWFCGHIHRDRIQDITLLGETEEIAKSIETAANKKLESGHFRVVKIW